MMSTRALSLLPIDPAVERRLLVQVHRRLAADDTRTVAQGLAQLTNAALVELCERLEDDEVHPPSRFCSCPACKESRR